MEYSKASNPQAAGAIKPVPILTFPASLHASGPSRIIPLDISNQLQCESPASSPSLLASFVRINAGESLPTRANATSQLFYVLSGSGSTRFGEHELPYRQGDLFTLPSGPDAIHAADSDSVFYWVNDSPLLQYLGVTPTTPRFPPTLYIREESRAALADAASSTVAAYGACANLSPKVQSALLLPTSPQPGPLTMLFNTALVTLFLQVSEGP